MKSNFKNIIKRNFNKFGIKKALPLQKKVWKKVEKSNLDIIIKAPIGSGKTLAYIIPIISIIKKLIPTYGLVIIISPSILTSFQLICLINQLLKGTNHKVGFFNKLDCSIWVGTPESIINSISIGKYDYEKESKKKLKNCLFLVYDEIDALLIGKNYENLIKIYNSSLLKLKNYKLKLSFNLRGKPKIIGSSAIIKEDDPKLNYIGLKNYKIITSIKLGKNIIHKIIYINNENEKIMALIGLLYEFNDSKIIIFCNSAHKALKIYRIIIKKSQKELSISCINKYISIKKKIKTIERVKNGKLKIIVSNDIISRGINMMGIDLIINYDSPKYYNNYQYRIGCVCPIKNSSIVYTFIDKNNEKIDYWKDIKNYEIIDKESLLKYD